MFPIGAGNNGLSSDLMALVGTTSRSGAAVASLLASATILMLDSADESANRSGAGGRMAS
jgi:hypothetical protein